MKACNCWADRYLKNWIQRKDGLQVPSVPDKLWIIFDCEVAGDMHVSGSLFTWFVVPMPCWVTTRTGMKICPKPMWRNCPRGFLVAFQKSCWRSSVEVYKENSLFHMFTWQYLKRKFLQEMLPYICIIWQTQQHLRLWATSLFFCTPIFLNMCGLGESHLFFRHLWVVLGRKMLILCIWAGDMKDLSQMMAELLHTCDIIVILNHPTKGEIALALAMVATIQFFCRICGWGPLAAIWILSRAMTWEDTISPNFWWHAVQCCTDQWPTGVTSLKSSQPGPPLSYCLVQNSSRGAPIYLWMTLGTRESALGSNTSGTCFLIQASFRMAMMTRTLPRSVISCGHETVMTLHMSKSSSHCTSYKLDLQFLRIPLLHSLPNMKSSWEFSAFARSLTCATLQACTIKGSRYIAALETSFPLKLVGWTVEPLTCSAATCSTTDACCPAVISIEAWTSKWSWYSCLLEDLEVFFLQNAWKRDWLISLKDSKSPDELEWIC